MSLRERATFNLLIVESGWAASFLIYPNLPKYRDLVLFHKVAREAIENGTGMWANPLTLTGYEFRMCYRLWIITRRLNQGRILTTSQRSAFVKRYCADMTTREIFEPQHYHRVAPHNRIFVGPREVNEAVGKISLLPGHT